MSEAASANDPSDAPSTRDDQPPLRDRWRDLPSPTRFAPDRPDHQAAMAAHRSAVEHGQMGYIDPASGLFVMTSVHLRDRGWCCDRGCRHCPYVGAGDANEESTT